MKKLFLVILLFAVSGQIVALDQQLKDLSAALTVLEEKLTGQAPTPSPQPLQPSPQPIPPHLLPPTPVVQPGGPTPPPPHLLPPPPGTQPIPVTPVGPPAPAPHDGGVLPPPPPMPAEFKQFVPPVPPMPDYEKRQYIKKPVYNPQRNEVLSTHEKYLSAAIGITKDGSLVVWGPTLKQGGKPDPAIFFDGKEFRYPNTEQINVTYEQGKAKAAYALFDLINMSELRAQKQYFDQLRTQFNQIEGRRAEVTDLAQAQGFVTALQNSVANILSAFNKPPLEISSIHPNAITQDVLTADQAAQFVSRVHSLLSYVTKKKDMQGGLVQEVETELREAQVAKDAKVAEQTTQKLKDSRWNALLKEKNNRLIQDKLDQLPAILDGLKAIDVVALQKLAKELQEQAKNQMLIDLDDYYITLQKTGKEQELGVEHPSSPSVTSSDSSDEESEESELSEGEEALLDTLVDEVKANVDVWLASTMSPLERGKIKDRLKQYVKLQRKKNAEWRPVGKYLQLLKDFDAL